MIVFMELLDHMYDFLPHWNHLVFIILYNTAHKNSASEEIVVICMVNWYHDMILQSYHLPDIVILPSFVNDVKEW